PFLQGDQPVVMNKFAAHATNIVIYDTLDQTRGKSFLIDGKSLDVKGGLTLPFGGAWASSNVLQLVNFTNEGTINIPQIANAGADRDTPYFNFINRGTNTASTHFIRSTNF